MLHIYVYQWIQILLMVLSVNVTNAEFREIIWEPSIRFKFSELHSNADASMATGQATPTATSVLGCLRHCQSIWEPSFSFVETERACFCSGGTGSPEIGTGHVTYGTVIETEVLTSFDSQSRKFLQIPEAFKQDCLSWYTSLYKLDGVYTIYPDGATGTDVYCDMSNGGWTVIQRRLDGSEDFYRGWEDYVAGFGSVTGEYWLGLDTIHWLTTAPSELSIYLEGGSDSDMPPGYANYGTFQASGSADNYMLVIANYSGSVGDAMTSHNGKPFSTYDNDNDEVSEGNCAEAYKGGWWYGACHLANINGLYLDGSHESYADGINWHPYAGYDYSFNTVVMKIRRT